MDTNDKSGHDPEFFYLPMTSLSLARSLSYILSRIFSPSTL